MFRHPAGHAVIASDVGLEARGLHQSPAIAVGKQRKVEICSATDVPRIGAKRRTRPRHAGYRIAVTNGLSREGATGCCCTGILIGGQRACQIDTIHLAQASGAESSTGEKAMQAFENLPDLSDRVARGTSFERQEEAIRLSIRRQGMTAAIATRSPPRIPSD